MSKLYKALARAEAERGRAPKPVTTYTPPPPTIETAYLQHLERLFPNTRAAELAAEARELLPTCIYPADIEPNVRNLSEVAVWKGYINERLEVPLRAKVKLRGHYLFKVSLPKYQAFAESQLDRIVREERVRREQAKADREREQQEFEWD